MEPFADHFSASAADYATFRPKYPAALFDHVASLVPRRELAWDAGTGNGQAAVELAQRFAHVVATDASAEQLARATPHPRVTYRVAREDQSGIADGAADLVASAQAVHWFDMTRFEREVARVLAPHGIVAVWCYGRTEVGPELDPVFEPFKARWVTPYWPPERHHVDTDYRELPFPFDELPAPRLTMAVRWTRRELLGYASTWSAIANARKATGRDPIAELGAELARVWPDEDERREVRWPVGMRIGRPRRARHVLV